MSDNQQEQEDIFTLTVKTGNAAFVDNPDELSRILRDIADKLERGVTEGKAYDFNGNNIGYFEKH